MGKEWHIQRLRECSNRTGLCIVSHIRKTQHRRLTHIYRNRILSVDIGNGAFRGIILVKNSNPHQRLAGLKICYHSGNFNRSH